MKGVGEKRQREEGGDDAAVAMTSEARQSMKEEREALPIFSGESREREKGERKRF